MFKIIKLTIEFKSNLQNEQLVYDYLSLLYKNGQISKEYLLYQEINKYIAMVNVSNINALDSQNNNLFIINILKYLNVKYEIIADSLIYNETCKCNEPSWYMLYSDYENTESPLRCGDCSLEIPFYKIPKINNEFDYASALKWQRSYQAIDQLWMDNIANKYTKNQLENSQSTLNKMGFDLRDKLNLIINKPVYLYLRQSKKQDDLCPICNNKMKKSKNEETVDFICLNCKIALDKME